MLRSFLHFLHEPWKNHLSAVLLLCGVAGLSVPVLRASLYASPPITTPESPQYMSHRCQVGPSPAGEVLNIYVWHRGEAYALAEYLCQHPVLQHRYRAIHFQWQQDELEQIKVLQNQVYQLLVAKPHSIEIPLIHDVAVYEPIARYASYASYLIGRTELPQLTTHYWSTKRLGLLDKATSQSGHVIPRKALREAGISEKPLVVQFYKGHAQLREALERGEVDVIGSFWNEATDALRFNHAYRLQLQEEVPPHHWYLAQSLMGTAVHCVLLGALQALAQHHNNRYFQELHPLRACGV